MDGLVSRVSLLVGLASALYMTGVITFVRRVHYPLFAAVGTDRFERYHAAHVARTTRVVAFPMVVELASALVLAAWPPATSSRWLAWLGLTAAASTWMVTAFVSVPAHNRLARGFEPAILRRLLAGDVVRAAGWWCHSAVLLVMCWNAQT